MDLVMEEINSFFEEDLKKITGFELEEVEITLPSDEQSEPEVYDGFVVVCKIPNEQMQNVKPLIEQIKEYEGTEVNIS